MQLLVCSPSRSKMQTHLECVRSFRIWHKGPWAEESNAELTSGYYVHCCSTRPALKTEGVAEEVRRAYSYKKDDKLSPNYLFIVWLSIQYWLATSLVQPFTEMKGTAIDFKETRQMLSFTILVCVFHVYGTYLQAAEKTEKSLTQIGGKRG